MAETFTAQLRKLGEAVRTERRRRSMTQEKLAEIADVDPTFISQVERGVVNLSFKNLARVARALRLKVAELCGRAGV
jgi:transcriptional regulator with XRE-family HTH domain